MKNLELLRRLQKNPFYQFSEEEVQALEQADKYDSGVKVSSVEEDLKKNRLTKGNAAAKEIGTFEKHPTDPTTDQ